MGARKRLRRCERSLVCAIQAVVGTHLLVELRNDVCIRGLLHHCDDTLNLIIKDCVIENVEGAQKNLPLIFIRGSHFRFIHLPHNLDISQAVEDRRVILDKAAYAYMGGKGLPAPKLGQTSGGTSTK